MSVQSRKGHLTQWAAQFYVAAELSRRAYLVSLTLGNTPHRDLLVVSPSEQLFSVEVKGLTTRNFWIVAAREPADDLYYVLVFLPPQQPPRFFVLTSSEAMAQRAAYREHMLSTSGKYQDTFSGFNWSAALEHEDRWDKLPDGGTS